jgi:hypothetical protein
MANSSVDNWLEAHCDWIIRPPLPTPRLDMLGLPVFVSEVTLKPH